MSRPLATAHTWGALPCSSTWMWTQACGLIHDRIPHPGIHRRRARVLEQDVARRARVLVDEEQRLLTVEDLKRVRHVGRARNARQVALDLRITSPASASDSRA